jgi:hypothetical protein
MPSLLHEGLLELVRNRPELVVELLRLIELDVPQFAHVRLAETALHEIVPVEHHADAVVLLIDDTPAMGVVVEAQLQPDDRKRFTWPLYAIAARARHLCPCIVLVLTADEATARWAAKPIDLGGGNYYQVHVIGPEGIPVVTEIERAMAVPELVLLSVMAHGRDDPRQALQIAVAAVAAVVRFIDAQAVGLGRACGASLEGYDGFYVFRTK